MSTTDAYFLTAAPAGAQAALESARARCRADGGPQYRVHAITPAGSSLLTIEPSEYDARHLAFDLERNRYTDIHVERVGS